MAKMTEIVCESCQGKCRAEDGTVCEHCGGTGLKPGIRTVEKCS